MTDLTYATDTLSVLIVEDDRAMRTLIAEDLAACGHVVQAVGTMYDALELLAMRQGVFDVVVVDLDLPDSTGLGSLHSALHGCSVPVVVYSGTDDPEASRQAVLMGASAYVGKDQSVAELAATMRQVAREGRPPVQAARPTEDAMVSGPLEKTITATLDYLAQTVPMGVWMLTRVTGDDWTILHTVGNGYPSVTAGDVLSWSDSVCSRMVTNAGPQIVGDLEDHPVYLDAPITRVLPIGRYCGVPIEPDGFGLFGTLCGIDPATGDVTDAGPTVAFAAATLTAAIAADLDRDRLQRRLDLATNASAMDVLTGLGNRRAFEQISTVEQARAQRYGHRVAVAVVDLDGLKVTNDTIGHHAGDRLLRQAADAIAATVRDSDLAFRIGGDEFAVIATPCTPAKRDTFADRLQRQLQRADIAASVGVSCQVTSEEPISDVLDRADARMYAAKRRAVADRLTP